MLGTLKKRNYQILSTNLRRHHGSLRHSPNSFIDRMFSMFDFDSKYVLTFVSQQTSFCQLVWELITKNYSLVAHSYLEQTVQAIVNCETSVFFLMYQHNILDINITYTTRAQMLWKAICSCSTSYKIHAKHPMIRTGLWLLQMEHTHVHIRHWYSMMN